MHWAKTVLDALNGNSNKGLIFHQLFEGESSTYSYLIADRQTRETILIDPVLETVERDSKLITDLGLKLKYCVNTHVHAKEQFQAIMEGLKLPYPQKLDVSLPANLKCGM